MLVIDLWFGVKFQLLLVFHLLFVDSLACLFLLRVCLSSAVAYHLFVGLTESSFSCVLLVFITCIFGFTLSPCGISTSMCSTVFCITSFFSNFFTFTVGLGLYLRLLYFLNFRWCNIFFVATSFDVIIFFISSYSFFSSCCFIIV